jgi:predicted DNA-binding ribbon-helix-helix protein
MWVRSNRSKHPWQSTDAVILADEKLVAFRISARRYAILKEIAAKNQKPIAQLINEILNNKLRLEERALRKEIKEK